MAVTLSDLVKDEANVNVAIGSETLHLVVRPYALSKKNQMEIETNDDLIDLVLLVTKSWDLMKNKTQKMPLNKEALEEIPSVLLRKIIAGVVGELTDSGESESSSFAP